MSNSVLSTEELLQRARGQALSAMLGIVAFLRSKGTPLEEWAHFNGNIVVPFWAHLKALPMIEVAQQVAMAMADFSAQIVSVSGDERKAEAVVEFHISDALQAFGITEDDFSATMEICRPVSDANGIQFAWSRSGTTYTLQFSR
jgi:hypothetical protein